MKARCCMAGLLQNNAERVDDTDGDAFKEGDLLLRWRR